jgi:hypothetical protein
VIIKKLKFKKQKHIFLYEELGNFNNKKDMNLLSEVFKTLDFDM